MYLVEKGDKAGTKRSIELFDHAIDLDPNFAAAWAGKGYAHCAYSHMGDNSPAVEYEIAGTGSELINRFNSDYQNTGWQGVLQTQRSILKAKEQKGAFSPQHYRIATLSALVGDKHQALESLNEAFNYRSANINFLKTDPRPRFSPQRPAIP